jgi:spermidine synthase
VEGADNSRTDCIVRAGHRGIILAVLILIGFTAVIAQIVLMRELLIVFHGNEMSLGWMLASWLLWTAIGSGVLGRVAARTPQPRRLVAALQALVAISLPSAVFLTRASREVFQTVPGEVLGPGPVVLTCFVVLSVFCIVSGALFAVGSRLYAQAVGSSTLVGTARVYLLEAVGSGLGGGLASLLLIQYLPPFEIAAAISLLNLLAATFLTVRSRVHRLTAIAALVAVFGLLVFPVGCGWLEKASLGRLWRGYDLVATRNSIYGNLAIVQTGEIRSLFENGLVSFNAPDALAAEEAVHFAVLQHPSPKSLLLIGGGANGSLTQTLQYASLERIDYVEIDPTVLDVAKKFFAAEWGPANGDPRVHLHNTDGRLFLKTTELKFDVVILNLADPQTAQLNRFYTSEFFEEVARKLTASGVFSFQLKGAEDYISPELADFLQCIYKTLRGVFPEVLVIPGDPVHFLASSQVGTLTVDAGELLARLRAQKVQTKYLREYYLPYRLMPDRVQDLESHLQAQADTRVNRDFAPVAYYYDVVLWCTRFNRFYREVLQAMGHFTFGRLIFLVGLALFSLGAAFHRLLKSADRLQASAGFCVAAMGFTLLGQEMVLLLAFQAIYGYVFKQLAIIIAGFMVGMALGSWRGLRTTSASRISSGNPKDLRRLAELQFLASISPLLLFWLLHSLAVTRKPPSVFLVSQILFPCLAVLCGFLGGYQFPVASRIFFSKRQTAVSSAGTLYALDLAGACLGALILTSYVVPIFGFERTSWLMGVVNLAPALLVTWLVFGDSSVRA